MGLEMALTDAGYEVVGPIGWFDQAMEAATVQDVDLYQGHERATHNGLRLAAMFRW